MSKDPNQDQDQDQDHDHDLAQKDLQFAVDTARDAFQQADGLKETVESLVDYCQANEDRIAELETVLDGVLDKSYSELAREEKISKIRNYLIERAKHKSNHAHAIDYDDVQWSVFNGEPSPSHAYDLMRLAADAPGFEFENPDNGNKQIGVSLTDLHSDASEGSGSGSFPAKNRGEEVQG